MLGVNICFIFFGWLLVIASVLLAYATFKRQSRLCIPYIIALFETVLIVILLECLPEFIDEVKIHFYLKIIYFKMFFLVGSEMVLVYQLFDW